MTTRQRLLPIIAGALLIGVCAASAQDENSVARNSIALRAGYGFSAGDWNKVPYLPTVTMMAGRVVYGIDVEVRVADRWTIGMEGGFEDLDGGDWEAYASSVGDTLSVDASFFYATLLGRVHLTDPGPNVLRLEFGPAAIFPEGKERYNGRVYTYDFFNSTKLGMQVGLEFDRALNSWIAAAVRAAALVAPTGISFASGETRTLIALPVTAGVRFYF